MSFLKNRIKAFGFAFAGLLQAFRTEIHLKIHLLAAIVVVDLGLYFSITKAEWFAILFCIGLVICTELINSAIERLCDKLMPEFNPNVKYIKDVAAAAVLIASLIALIIGLMIFLPYFGAI
jgi:diacylglycerol kinase